MTALAAEWLHAARSIGARGDLASPGADLLARYAEPHRRYHNSAHLADVLRHVDELASHAPQPDVVRVAAWFHDAIYEPRRADNEARSADLAETALRALQVDDAVIAEVVRLVHLTASHVAEAGDGDAAVLCDADLAVLAAPDDRYAAYVDAVRAEYSHVDDRNFAIGRAAILRSFLTRQRLFLTATAWREWEAPARRNMSTELSRYHPPPPEFDHVRDA